MKNREEIECPCDSGKKYADCCKAFHEGKWPSSAEELMRSRYAAYAMDLPAYIMETTHPSSRQFSHDKKEWSQNISSFSRATEFRKLEILGGKEKGPFATVTFFATLFQNGKDLSYTERSLFERIKGRWLYRGGLMARGRDLGLVSEGPPKILPIAYYGDPILRKVAVPVEGDIGKIRKLIEEMIETMDECDGLGLAAPQVHHSIQLFVIRRPVELEGGKIEFGEVKVFINPVLSDPSEKKGALSEGCLSIPSIQADVERPLEVTVEYTDLEGHRIKERVAGWEARVIMHENDHINGILFIDHLNEETKKNLEPALKELLNKYFI